MSDQNRTPETPPTRLPDDQHPMRGKVIDLSTLEFVAQGNRRFVYLIRQGTPGFEMFDFPLVLKVPRYEDREQRMNAAKRFLSRLFPSTAERGIRVEARYWSKLASRVPGDPINMPLPVFRGYVMTTGGNAALWDAMCDENGDLAPTLREFFQRGESASLVEPLNRFVAFTYEHNLVAPDIQATNMVLVERRGRKEIVLVDGYADMRLISMRSMFVWRNKKNMEHRFSRMAGQANLGYDKKKRCFYLPETTD